METLHDAPTDELDPREGEGLDSEEFFPSETATAVPSLRAVNQQYKSKIELAGLFEKEDSFPLPDGYRHVGVVFECLTVHGADAGLQHVESFEVALFQVC